MSRNSHAKIVPKIVFLVILLVAAAGLVLGIYGADKSIDNADVGITINRYIQSAMAVYLLIYAILVSLVIIFASKWGEYKDSSDKKAVLAMAFATPFIGIKHVYAAIGDYGHVKGFGLLTGSTTAYLLMDVLMEMIAMIIILSFGLAFAKASMLEVASEDHIRNEAKDSHTGLSSTRSESGV